MGFKMKRKKNRSKAKPNTRPVPVAEYASIEPIPEAGLTLDKMSTYSSKKLLVTAMALNKKSEQEENPEIQNAMLKMAVFITQMLQGRAYIEQQAQTG
tara:strand:+ start:185 stop:478 length:294 start_codon:yes stop_codon:yes gene_type:complete